MTMKHKKFMPTDVQKIRFIAVSNKSGSEEDVYFVDDPDEFEEPGENWCSPEQSVDCDMIFNMELPADFPFNSQLRNMH